MGFILLCCLPFGSAQAAAKIDLAIDGVVVPAQGTAENSTSFYLGARPQMRNGSVFVPVRVVSELFGAKVSWLGEMPDIGQSVVIEYNGELMQLFTSSILGHRGKGTGTWDFTQIPYEKDGSIYVPIRFVAEAFGCDVEWQAKKNLVNIKTKPWELDGRQIVGVARGVNMGTREIVQQADSPYFARQIYQTIQRNLGEQIDEPQYTWQVPEYFPEFVERDTSVCYMLDWLYFMLVDDDNAALRVELYSLCQGETADRYVLRLADKWYVVPEQLKDDLYKLFEQSNYYGFDYYKVYTVLEQTN